MPAASAVVVTEHVRAELLAHAPQGLAPGAEAWLGLRIEHQPGWHTYWKNPGDSGLPTSLAWQLPKGLSVQDIDWPTPQALKVGPLVNYGYSDRVLLPVPLHAAADATTPATVRLHAEWLVCEKICIPESGDFVLELAATPAIAHAEDFQQALANAPRDAGLVTGSTEVAGDMLVVRLDRLPPGFQGQVLQYLPETGGVIDHAAPITQQALGARGWMARVPLSPQQSEKPDLLAAVLLAPGQNAGLRVEMPVAWDAPAAAAVNSAPASTVADNAPPPPPPAMEWTTWLLPGLALFGILVALAWNKFKS